METAEGPRHIRTGKCTYVKMEVYAKNEKKTEIPRFSRKVTWDLRTPRKEGEDGRVGRQVSALAVPTGVLTITVNICLRFIYYVPCDSISETRSHFPRYQCCLSHLSPSDIAVACFVKLFPLPSCTLVCSTVLCILNKDASAG